MALLPVLRRLPRRVDRVTSALEQGRLSVNVRLFADERDRAVANGMLHELLLVVSALLGLRLLFVVFRSQRRNAGKVTETS